MRYALIRNGMGDYTVGAGAKEDDLLYMSNILFQGSSGGIVTSTDLAVSEKGSGADMSVDVAKGRCFIPNSSWAINTNNQTKYWPVLSDSTENVEISSNSSGNPRIDIIVAKMNTAVAPNENADNDVFTIEVVEGTPAASPSAPTTPSNSYKLAEVAVANGAVSIVDANITDTRSVIILEDEYLGAEIQTYTPVFSADGGSPTIDVAGGGSIEGRYFKQGKKVICWIEAMLGPSFSFGTGQIYFSLPFDVGANALPSYFPAEYEDVGTAIYYGQPLVYAGAPTKTHVLRVTRADVTYARGANVSSTVPFTWASGDYLRLGPIIYETDE